MADSRYKLSNMKFIYVFTFVILFLEPKNTSVIAHHDINDNDHESTSLCNNANPTSILPSPYRNLSGFACSPTWNNYAFSFFQNQKDNVTTIILSGKYTSGWVGIGFSDDGGMFGSTAVVGWIGKDGKAAIKRYFLQGYTSANVIPDKGKLQFTSVLPVIFLHGADIYMAFQLKFAVHLTVQSVILALGSEIPVQNILQIHQDKTSMAIQFSSGSASLSSRENVNSLKRKHGAMGIIAWGALLPVGAIIPRYFKHHDPLWYYLHAIIQVVGFVVGLAGISLGRILYDEVHANFPLHRGIGLFVTLLSVVQVMAIIIRPNKESKCRKYWNWYHHWVGRVALFLGALNIVMGIQIGGGWNVWKMEYGFLLAAVLTIFTLLEVLSRLRGAEKAEEAPVLT